MSVKDQEIQDWFCNFITTFRKNYEKLSEFEKTGIDNSMNFLEPCQIEIFGIKNPELQLIVQSNFPDRKDMEVIIHGPFEGKEFYEKVEPLLAEEKWQKKPDNESDEDDFEISEVFGDPEETLSEILAKQLYQMLAYAKFLLFYPHDVGDIGEGSQIDKNMWAGIHVGNIVAADYEKKIEQMMTQIKSGAKSLEEMRSQAPKLIMNQLNLKEPFRSSAIQVQKKGGYGFGVHIFPPVIVGTRKKPTIRQLLEGVQTDTTIFDKALDIEINDKVVIVHKDGYVFVESDKKEEALKILNLIMALGTIFLTPMFAVREQDVSTAGYGENRSVSSKQWNPQTIRSQLHEHSSMFDFSLNHDRFEITKEQITNLIHDVFEIMEDGDLANDLKIFIEAFTYNRSTEYAQSFVMSWSIIERYYSSMWEKILNEKQFDKKRLDKLLNQWSIDYVLESLNIIEKINNEDYKLLMELKKKRNGFYHGKDKQISKEDAGKCLNLVRKIISKKLDTHSSD